MLYNQTKSTVITYRIINRPNIARPRNESVTICHSHRIKVFDSDSYPFNSQKKE